MTDETPKPQRKRRRWIIVGVLLFVAVGGWWWFWPRVDPRFIGTWRSGPAKSHFQSDGFVKSFVAQSNRGGAMEVFAPTRLRVRGGRFQLVGFDTSFRDWVQNSYRRWKRGRKDELIFEGRVYFDAELVEVDEKHFLLRDGDRTYRFERVE